MEENINIKKIQDFVDQKGRNFIRPAMMKVIYQEKLIDGVNRFYCMGDDQPNLIFRIFDIDLNGEVKEIDDVDKCVELTKHFRDDIVPTLESIPPQAQEDLVYNIQLENITKDNAVELKLKSSTGRELTMIEVYRYFDNVTQIFFVSCISLSYPGQYLFSVVPGGKQLKLLLTRDTKIRSRIDMITELLHGRVLPSYRTIEDANKVLSGEINAQITLNDENNKPVKYQCNFCYDDDLTMTRFAFFSKLNDKGEEDTENRAGVILSVNIFNNNELSTGDSWTDLQKEQLEKIREQMKNDDPEVKKHIASFFTDNLDFRYKLFKEGKLEESDGIIKEVK